MFIPERESPVVLPSLRLEDTRIADLGYLVSPLFVHCSNRPELVEDEGIGSLECDVYSGFHTARWEGDVGEDCGWECVAWEIVYQ
jgi:hypothetical protein